MDYATIILPYKVWKRLLRLLFCVWSKHKIFFTFRRMSFVGTYSLMTNLTHNNPSGHSGVPKNDISLQWKTNPIQIQTFPVDHKYSAWQILSTLLVLFSHFAVCGSRFIIYEVQSRTRWRESKTKINIRWIYRVTSTTCCMHAWAWVINNNTPCI